MANILAIDDDEAILTMIRKILSKDNHQVTTFSHSESINTTDLTVFDLIILDVMMPGTDGFGVCKEIRNLVDCPILFLTAKTEEEALVCGLEAGGDDYIGKPFGALELRARVAAHLRREKREHLVRLSFSNGYFNLSSKQLFIGEEAVPLTKGEYRICEFLARNAGQVFSREQIFEKIFGYDKESNDTTIAMHIKNIRKKLEMFEASPIKTVWGIGYKWED